MIKLINNIKKECLIDINIFNIKSLYEIYLKNALTLKEKFSYTYYLDYHSNNIITHQNSKNCKDDFDLFIMNQIQQDNKNFYQYILCGIDKDGSIHVVDGVHRMWVNDNKNPLLAIEIEENIANEIYIDLIIPSNILKYEKDIMAFTTNNRANIVIIDSFYKDEIEYFNIKIKGYTILLRLLILLSIYIDKVYEIAKNNNIELSTNLINQMGY